MRQARATPRRPPLSRSRVIGVGLVLALSCAASPAGAGAQPRPFGHPCALQSYGVRFCPTDSLGDRVSSWDGAPLDVDVTLPPSGDGPFPTIFIAHGYGQDKTAFESTSPPAGAPASFFADHFNNAWLAQRGYAVVTYTARGAGNSCGTEASRQNTPACDNVTFELADQRYDARDVQYLLGLLVDEGTAKRNALGVTGLSLGSIVSSELALLKDRIRLPDGRYAPWMSPAGTALHIAAAYPEWAVGDTLDLLAPNGRFLDFQPGTATSDRGPFGTVKGSFPVGASLLAPAAGVYSSPTASFSVPRLAAECATAGPAVNPVCASDLAAIADYHQAIGIPIASTPAPILFEGGWDDTVTNGASQSIRLADYLSQVAPAATISIQAASVGHGNTINKAADILALNQQANDFFDHYLKGAHTPTPAAVTAYTSTCPPSEKSAGPFTAPSWSALHPGAVRFGSTPSQVISSGGDPSISWQIDPVAQGPLGALCKTYQASDYPGTAVYSGPVTKTFTMLGLPTLRMKVGTVPGTDQLDARLWDVGPGGQEEYVSRGTYALTAGQQGTITWQLFGAGHTFLAGHTMRLELLNSDTPYLTPADNAAPLTVSDVLVELPAYEPPRVGGNVSPRGRACVSAKMTFVIHPVPHGRVVKVLVSVNGRRVLTKTGHDIKRISFARPPGSRLVVDILTTNNRGGRVRTTRTFRDCTRTNVSGKVVGRRRSRDGRRRSRDGRRRAGRTQL